MRALINPFAVLILKQADHLTEQGIVQDAGLHAKSITYLDGINDGVPAQIVVARDHNAIQTVKTLARQYRQQHVLFVRNDQSAYVHEIATGEEQEVGTWRGIEHDAVTAERELFYDHIHHRYYAVVK